MMVKLGAVVSKVVKHASISALVEEGYSIIEAWKVKKESWLYNQLKPIRSIIELECTKDSFV